VGAPNTVVGLQMGLKRDHFGGEELLEMGVAERGDKDGGTGDF